MAAALSRWKWWLVGAGLLALTLRPRRAPSTGAPSTGDREGWVRLEDETGLAVRLPSRSWTSPAVREVLRAAGRVAAELGGQLQIGDAGPEVRGAQHRTHKSHRWGRDVDLAYTLERYPTDPEVPVDGRLVDVIESIAPFVEVVYASPARMPALEGHGFDVAEWPGHEKHLHLRLRADLASERAAT